MKKQSTIGRVVRFGIGAAVLAAAAFASDTASALPPFQCSAGGSQFLAYLYVSTSNPGVCIRQTTTLPVPPGTPNCWAVAKANNLPCVNPITREVNIITIQ
ncbi:MAG: hypothetical protein QM820_37230 [Minicystis sp.]